MSAAATKKREKKSNFPVLARVKNPVATSK
jgi:hypothetical protein